MEKSEEKIINQLTSEFNLRPEQVTNTVKLIDDGNTIPFIARYRKEATGSLSDEILRDFYDRLSYLRNLEDKKEEIEIVKVTEELIKAKTYEVRGYKVMLDFDLAELYGTETRLLKRAVRRNMERFPDDFMFELTNEEANCLLSSRVSQIGIPQYNFSAYTPFAFTEQGVAMLSSVLHSTVAIKVNINIMRAFVSIRQYVLASDTKNQEIDELRQRIQELESQGSKAFAMINQIGEETLEAINDLSEDTRKELDSIYLALSELADKEKTESLKSKHRRPIGFIHYDNEE